VDTPFTDRLLAATNAHDVDAIVACFADDYVNEMPCHPARGFTGREQVRMNWTSMLAAVPDLRAEVVAAVRSEGVEWTQWEMRGNARDGSTFHLAGVILFEVEGDVAKACRFFLEPVDVEV
jgi:hypothetical protein